jgi:predicted DNA-binding transcriptional regulator YafY
MRASRLLHLLLLLQNRGRMTSTALAAELEVAPRTVLRDIDALTEAGLPVVTYQGNRGGFELGFNYRSRLTGLAADEAEALAVLLSDPTPALAALGMREAAMRAASKLIESFPDGSRERIAVARQRFRFEERHEPRPDRRVESLAKAVRGRNVVRLRSRSVHPQTVHPEALLVSAEGWQIVDALAPKAPIPMVRWGDINISSKTF